MLGVGALALAGTIAFVARPREHAGQIHAAAEVEAARVLSNVEPADYVGPDACAQCHEERWAQWREHPHSRMNQDASADSIIGDFSGITATYGGVTTHFEIHDGVYTMAHERDGVLLRRDRVTRTIGSRFQQAYVGVQVEGPEPPGDPIYTTERALPFVWWFSRQQWLPEHFVEEYPQHERQPDGSLSYPTDDPYSRGARPWSEGCMLCHNTYAYVYRASRDMPGTGFGGVELVDAAPHGPQPSQLVTLGVSCEACHFGGRDHATRDAEAVDVPTGPALRAFTPPAHTTNSICAQCHVAGTLPWPNDAASLNSSEARDMMAGACSSAIECTACHDPHVASSREVGIDRPEHVAACLTCHDRFASEEHRRAHARHAAADASCLDCHMPRITQGIEAVVRSHRIDSPTNPAMLAAGAPNACNLCHLDRSIAWTVEQLREHWGAQLSPTEAWQDWYGNDLADPVGEVWLQHAKPAVRLVAAAAYARSPLGRTTLPLLLDLLLDDYPHVRMFALFAIEQIVGRRLDEAEYTPTASQEEREQQVEALRARFPAP